MKGLKQRLKRPPANVTPNKEGTWTRQDQRVWQAVAGNQPTKVAAKLSKHPDVDVNKICPNVGYSVVHYSAAKGLDDCLNILLTHRADASSRDITGATPLHAAARYGHKGTTSKLLASRSVTVNLADKNNCTALHFAAFEGHNECVKLIADAPDADLHSRDKDGRTPLMVGAAMGHLEVCKELLERDANVHNRDSTLGHTALTLASDSGHADVVRLLCDHGARLSMALYDGRSALKLAKDRDRKSVVDALHIAQLTEAANKAPNGPRLSTSSNKYRDPAAQKKRHSVDSILDNRSEICIDDLVAGTHLSTGSRTPKAVRRTKEEKKSSKSNIARVKAAVEAKMKTNSRRGSDASGLSSASSPKQKGKQEPVAKASPVSNRLSLYAEGDSSHFYDKEMKFYDTSLSNSSLDVSSTSSAFNNISKSMDSLKPTLEDAPYETPATAVNSTKVEGTDFTSRQANAEIQRHQKAKVEYERRIQELETKLLRANDVAIATEKLQKNAEEIRTAQISAQKEDHNKNQAKMQEELERMRQTSVGFEKQNKELLRRLTAAQQIVATTESLREQLKDSKDECNDIAKENETLKEEIERLKSQNQEMKTIVAKEKENESTIITRAKQKVIEAEQRCNQVERRCSDAEQRREETESKCTELEQKLNENEDRCNQLVQRCDHAQQQCTEMEHKYADAEHKCSEMEQKFNEADKNCTRSEEKLSKVVKEKKLIEIQVNELKESLDEDVEELTRHRNEVSEIMQMLWEANNSEPAEPVDVSDVKAQVQILVEKLKVEEDLLRNVGSDKKVLEEKHNTSLDEKSKRIKELEGRIKEVEAILVQKTADNSRLEAELQNANGLVAESETKRKNLENDLGKELVVTRSELAQYRAEKIAHADQYARSRDEMEELRKQLDEALSSMRNTRQESVAREVYEADSEKWKADTSALKKELVEALERIAQVQLEIANKEQEISDLRVERNQSEAKATKHESELAALKAKFHESDVQVNVLRQQLTDAKHKVEKATEESENLRKSRRDLTLRLSTKQGEMSEVERKKVDSLRRQLEHLCKHLQESERRYKDTISIYRGHLLAAVKGELNSDVQSALQEILKLRGKDEEKGQGSHL